VAPHLGSCVLWQGFEVIILVLFSGIDVPARNGSSCIHCTGGPLAFQDPAHCGPRFNSRAVPGKNVLLVFPDYINNITINDDDNNDYNDYNDYYYNCKNDNNNNNNNNNFNNDNNYTFPVRRPGVHLDHHHINR
jgi:hypothetical protein